MILVFLIFSLKPALSLSSFTLIKRLFSSSSLASIILKRVQQGSLLLSCLFNLYAEYIMRNAWLDELQVVIKIGGRNIDNLRYVENTTLMAESKEKLWVYESDNAQLLSLWNSRVIFKNSPVRSIKNELIFAK